MPRQITQEEFIKQAIAVHGNKYDYSKTVYDKMLKRVTITCPVHGDFDQFAYCHTHLKQGCQKCSHIFPVDKEKFVAVATKVHNGKYDYSNINYIDRKTPVEFTCSIHGKFEQTPKAHMRGNGCKACAKLTIRSKRLFDNTKFIQRAKAIHGDKYDYDKVQYKSKGDKVIITCPLHGDFYQVANSHLRGHGCPHCKRISKGETRIEQILLGLGVKFEKEYSIPGYRYRFDFYLPDHNLLIEYDGRQHFLTNSWNGENGLFEIQKRDNDKNAIASENDYRLLRISYKMHDNIRELIMTELEKGKIHFVGYCDGSCKGNPGYSGFGVFGYTYKYSVRPKNIKHPAHPTLSFTTSGVLKEKDTESIEVDHVFDIIHAMGNPKSTNNDAELLAFTTAMKKALTIENLGSFTIYTDSNYVVTSFNENLDKWLVNDWRRLDGKQIVHVREWDVINQLRAQMREAGIKINVQWVKGHSDSYGNIIADLYSNVGSNASIRQLNDPSGKFDEVVLDTTLTYKEYKDSYPEKDITMFFRDIYFTSNATTDDTNYCFLCTSETPNTVGKRDTSSIFVTNVGFVPEVINAFKRIYRSVPRVYAGIATMKLNKLENKDLLRLTTLVKAEDLVTKTIVNNSLQFRLIGDTTAFMTETGNEYPFVMRASGLFNKTLHIHGWVEDDPFQVNCTTTDITNLIVKDGVVAFTNKDKTIDVTDIFHDPDIRSKHKQRLLISIGYDIPSFLALKSIEDKIKKVTLVIEDKPDTNFCTIYVCIETEDRKIYSVNVEDKFLKKRTDKVTRSKDTN